MINSPACKVPSDFTEFMIILICEFISSYNKRAFALLKCNEIYFSEGDNFFFFNESGIHIVVRLKTNQEVGDNKVILHCLKALNDLVATIVIRFRQQTSI